MTSLGFWSMLIILYQTVLSIIISWSVLNCKLSPQKNELHEVTLLKILYLYDPIACDKVHFYNVTVPFSNGRTFSTIVWPTVNPVATEFRTKIQVWLSLHIIWAVFAVINVSQSERSCSFYVTLLPFTLAGLVLLVLDLVYCVLFLCDAKYTSTEAGVLMFIVRKGQLRGMNKNLLIPKQLMQEDTTWMSLVLAYFSVRGLVQWLVNFWIVKDNYFEGLARYRQRVVLRNFKPNKSSLSLHARV